MLFSLRLNIYLSPQLLQTEVRICHASLPHFLSKDSSTAEPLHSEKVMLSSPSTLLRAHPPPSRLSAHFVLRLIKRTLLLPFPSGARRVSPVDRTPIFPCRRCYPATVLLPFSQWVSKRMLPSPKLKRLGQWSLLLRGYTYVHFRYNPDSCSPC